jgi:hypothetical protein
MSGKRGTAFSVAVLALAAVARSFTGQGYAAEPPRSLAKPVEDGPFLRPAAGNAAEPTWGIKGGIAVGLWPNGGPRGLIRVYTPYLGQARLRVMNFIAVEPIVRDLRGLSELEFSKLDNAKGKAMWTGDTLNDVPKPRPPWHPARGIVTSVDGKRILSFYVFVESFDNGARPIIEVRLREDAPHEITFRIFSARGGKPMRVCVLTSTMGNYARLRRLWLNVHIADAHALYRSARFDRVDGFADHRQWGIDALLLVDGEAVVAARPDEPDPVHATYSREVQPHWHYVGKTATQYWRSPAGRNLVARVNARQTYWASHAPIPGGVAFENFEMEAPYRPGQKFVFGITPELPEALGFRPAN